MMSGPQTLQGLCTVCYQEQPKYKCPRCKTQTCSLPCYKRHQERASCNGQRNPAGFVKRSQWATPAGIDRDYNYLKSVERNIERADDDLKPLVSATQPKNSRQAHHSEGKLYRYLQQNNITVDRAPVGMSKSKANKTRVAQSGKVFWTVEWIDSTGDSFIDEDCPESTKLHDLHISAMKKRGKTARPRQLTDTGESASKRRRFEEPSEMSQLSSAIPSSTATSTSDVTSEAAITTSTSCSKIPSEADQPQIGPSRSDSTHFYLLRPTGSGVRVLIPLQARQDLTAALRERTVQEFPSIYVLPYTPEELPSGLILEETFLAKHKPAAAKRDAVDHFEQPTLTPRPTAEQILDMLRRDVRAV